MNTMEEYRKISEELKELVNCKMQLLNYINARYYSLESSSEAIKNELDEIRATIAAKRKLLHNYSNQA